MRYDVFKRKVQESPYISGAYLASTLGVNQSLRTQIVRWMKQGKLIRLKRDFYLLAEEDRKIHPSRLFLSQEIYRPSYISMEYALSYHGLIPERVEDITCISTNKTMVFETPLGNFRYQNIQRPAFTGFKEEKDEAGLIYWMAYPEKALADFCYLNRKILYRNPMDILSASYRMEGLDELDAKRLRNFSGLFHNNVLNSIIDVVIRNA